MISKEYKIITIRDVLDVVNESNIDSFMNDFRFYIETVWNMQKLFNSIAESENIPVEIAQLVSEFNWVDDGKQKHKIILNMKQNGDRK